MNDSIMNPTDPEQGLPASPEPGAPKESAGARLRSEREARSWTIEQVASQLNLAPRQIEALEQDNFAALPGIAIVRGFIRAYAKLLKIEPAIVIGLLPAENVQSVESLPARPTLATPFSRGASLPSLNGGSTGSRRTMILAALGLLVVLGFAALQLGWISSPSLPFPIPGLTNNAPTAAQPDAGAGAAAAPASPEPADVPAVQPELPPAEAVGQGVSAGPVAEASHQDAPATPSPAVPAKNELVLTMHEDSWIEVRRAASERQAENVVQFARLVKAGSSEAIDVSEPIILTIGNVSGVEATLRGAAFDLKAGAKNNVARINVK